MSRDYDYDSEDDRGSSEGGSVMEKAQDFVQNTFVPFMQNTAIPKTKEYSIKSYEFSRDVIYPFVKEQSIRGYQYTVETIIPYIQEVAIPKAKELYENATKK